MTFLDRLNLPKCDFRQNRSGGKIIKYLQSQVLTSHFESFWSIVVRIEKYFQLEMSSKWQKSPYLAKMITQQLKDKNLKRNAVVSNEVWGQFLAASSPAWYHQTIDHWRQSNRITRWLFEIIYTKLLSTIENYSRQFFKKKLVGICC